MDHPAVKQIERTGYPFKIKNNYCEYDSLGNEVLEGDEILVLDDEFYLIDELFGETIEVLKNHGANSETA